MFKFTEAISFVIRCDSHAEVDNYWEKLSAAGSEGQCGWIKDRFGLSWQIVPDIMGQLIGGDDPAKSQRAMQAMMQMGKLDIAALEAARAG